MAAHERYGSVITIAPNALTFSSLSALQTIHAKDSNVFKGNEFYGLLDGGADGGRSVQMTQDNAAHAARRRVLNRAMPARDQAFRDVNALAKSFASTAYGMSSMSSGTAKVWSAPVDISLIATWFSFDVISMVSFGESLDLLRSSEYRWLPGCLRSLSIFLYWCGYARGLSFWQWFLGTSLPSRLGMRTAVDAQIYASFTEDQVDRRAARLDAEKGVEAKRTDIFRHLMEVGLYSKEDNRADCSLLVAAGSDAFRLTIAATIFYWFKNPAVFERVTEEIRSAVPSADHISDASISSLHYLRACIDETMRLSPAKASSLPREVMKGGITIDGIHVPAGATVGSSVYALHHDPEIYPDPYAYNPDRWLQQPQDRRMQAAFCPFLKGPRMCPGQTVAYFAMQLALFHLIYRYDVRPAGGKVTGGGGSHMPRGRHREDEYQFNDWIIGFANGPLVELKELV